MEGGIEYVLGTLEPLLGLVLAIHGRIGKPQGEPGCRHVGQHAVQGCTQQFSGVDRGAVKNQFRALGAGRLRFLGNVGLPRTHKVGNFLPVCFPGRALFLQAVKPSHQRDGGFISGHLAS